MPRIHRRRRNQLGDRVGSRPRYSGSKSDSSSDERSLPAPRTAAPASPYHRPAAEEDGSADESSGGWSSSADFSGHLGDEEVILKEMSSQPIDVIQEKAESVGDGLLLVSDDENDMVEEDDDDYLSGDSALRVHRMFVSSEPPPPHAPLYEEFDGTHLLAMDAFLDKADWHKIPSSVAIHEGRMMDQLDTSDPSMDDSSGKYYDSRYDGSLQELMQGSHRSGSSHGPHENDDDDDDSSMDEMKGYLSTGDLRCPNILLKPNVGERPPTPPSPNRKVSKRAPRRAPENAEQPMVLLLEEPERSNEITWTPPRNKAPLHFSVAPKELDDDAASDGYSPKSEMREDIHVPNVAAATPLSTTTEEEEEEDVSDGYTPKSDGYSPQLRPILEEEEENNRWKRKKEPPPESALPRRPGTPPLEEDHDDWPLPHTTTYDTEHGPSRPQSQWEEGSSREDVLRGWMEEQQRKHRRWVTLLLAALLCALVALAAVAGGVVALLLTQDETAAPAPQTMAPKMVAPPTRAPMAAPTSTRVPIVAPVVSPPTVRLAPTTLAPVTFAPVSLAPATPAPVSMAPVTPKPSLRPVAPVPTAPIWSSPSTPVPAPTGSSTTTFSPVAFGGSVPRNPTAIPTTASIKLP